jgi:lipopolysaccharide export LptBFGC system permease protein LptF
VARLIRARELLLLETAGVGARRALAAIMIPALLLGLLGLGLRQFALPDLADAARESPYGAFEYRKGKRISVRDDDGNVWFVRQYNLDTRSVLDVRILDRTGTRLIVADELVWVEDQGAWWSPAESKVYDLAELTSEDSAADGAPVSFDGGLPFGRVYTADFARRRRSFTDRPLHELWTASAASRDDLDLNVALWHALWHPFVGFILLSCGVGLILSRRGLKPFAAGSLAILAVVGYYILQFWFETLAQSGAISPVVGAGVTPVLFGIFGAIVFWRT